MKTTKRTITDYAIKLVLKALIENTNLDKELIISKTSTLFEVDEKKVNKLENELQDEL